MELPDLIVQNPLTDPQRATAAAVLMDLAHASGAHAGDSPTCDGSRQAAVRVLHRQRELAAEVRAVSTKIIFDYVPVSLLQAAHRALDTVHAELVDVALSVNTQPIAAAINEAISQSRRRRCELAAIEFEQTAERGFGVREALAMPDPLSTPQITFTVGLSREAALPELVIAAARDTVEDALVSIAERVVRQGSIRSERVGGLLTPADGLAAWTADPVLRQRVSNASWGRERLMRPPEVIELRPRRHPVTAARSQTADN